MISEPASSSLRPTHRRGTRLSSAFALAACCVLPPTQGAAQAHPWSRVQAIPAHQHIRVLTDTGPTVCTVDSVDDERILCSGVRSGARYNFARSEVREVKASVRGHSAAVNAAVGLGIGAGAGALAGLAINSGDRSTYLHTSGAKAFGVGAALGGAAFAIADGLIGVASPSSVLYRRP